MLNFLRSLLIRLRRWDVALSYTLFQGDSAPPPWLASVGAHWGDSWLWAAVAGLFWWRSSLQPDDERAKTRSALVGWLLSTLFVAGVTGLFKSRIRRVRPAQASWLYGRGADVYSFPSGHAARMGALMVWSDALMPVWGSITWPLTVWVLWSRVRLGIHYVGDVAAGWLLGLSLAGVVRWLRSRLA